MTKHKEIEKLIQKCLDREITADENINLQLHLSQCPDCAALYDQLILTEQAIITLAEFVPNHGFNNRVLSQIKVKKVPVWAKVLGVIGGAWLVTFLTFLLSPLSRDAFGRFISFSPSLVRFADNIHFIGSTLSRVFTPVAKSQFNPSALIIGLALSIGMFLFFGKLFSKKETVWTA
jgi:hypothetical protein